VNKNVKSIKIMSVCLVMVLMASMFLISGVNAQADEPELPPLDLDSRTALPGNSTLPIPDDPEPDRFGYSNEKCGQLYSTTGAAVGVYGAQVVYLDPSGTDSNPFFVPTVVVKCDSNLGNYWGVFDIVITATAKFPNGTPVQLFQYNSLEHLITPESAAGATQFQQGITMVVNMIKNSFPSISFVPDITTGSTSGGGFLDGWTVADSKSGNSATSTFHQTWYVAIPPSQRGHQFSFRLQCDPQVPGNYVVDFNYDITLGGAGYAHESINQQVVYEYNPTPGARISRVESYSKLNSGSVNNPGNVVGFIDEQCAQLYAPYKYDQAMIVGELNTQKSGRVYIYGYIGPGYLYTNLLVYTSSDGVNWNQLPYNYVYKSKLGYIDCGKANNIKYVSIVLYNHNDCSSMVYVDAVYVYNY